VTEPVPRHLLGVDLGERRIGLAVSDPTGLLTTALNVLPSRGRARDAAAVAEAAAIEGVEGIVIGVPVNMDGSYGPQAEKSRRFGEMLAKRFEGPIIYWDERLTTVEASRYLRDSGMRRQKRRETLDAAAAAVLLQGYLDYLSAASPWSAARPLPRSPSGSSVRA
jgi:putative Holliday junction resolvase